MTGKQTCDILKQIRRDIAKKDDSQYPDPRLPARRGRQVSRHLPAVAEPLKRGALEKALNDRKKTGKKLLIAAVSPPGFVVGDDRRGQLLLASPGRSTRRRCSPGGIHLRWHGAVPDDESSETEYPRFRRRSHRSRGNVRSALKNRRRLTCGPWQTKKQRTSSR